MPNSFINEILKNKLFTAPSKESLLEKITSLEQALSLHKDKKLSDNQKEVFGTCKAYIQDAKECTAGFSSHPHLIWNLLHRVDEYMILLVPEDELYSKALDLKTAFNLTITEENVRADV